MVCLFSLTGFAGSWSWWFEITSHFRAQYAVLLLCFAAAVFWKRQRATAAAFVAFAGLNCWLLVPYLSGSPTLAATAGSTSIRLLCWNVNSANRSFAELDRLVREHNPDMAILLEVSPEWQAHFSRSMTNFPQQIVEARDDNFGIALLSRAPLGSARVEYFGPAGLPSIKAVLPSGNQPITLLATHPLPPAGGLRSRYRDEQLREIAEWVRLQTSPVIVTGDLNITPWSPVFADFCESAGLRNSAEGRGLQGTWPAFFPPMLIPIDHFLHSEEVLVTHREIVEARGSDHLPQVVEFGLR